MRQVGAWSLAAAMVCSLPATALADEKQACMDAYEHGQELRQQGKLREAREQMLACARDRCPALAQQDCSRWLGELEEAIPSIIQLARDRNEQDLVDVHVLVDGAPLTDHLDGKPLPIDPGEHTLRFERSGDRAVEQTVVVAAGEKNRIVSVVLAPAALVPSPPGPSAASNGPSAWSFVLAAAGLAAAGTSTYFEIKGLGDRQHLFETCAGRCASSAVDSAYDELRVGDVSALVA
ncbi:MAG: hypothetical protein ACRELB_23095, partial [Polyangiaceae bacterium]